MKKLALVLVLLVSALIAGVLWGSPKNTKAVTNPVCQVVDVEGHYEHRHCTVDTYKCPAGYVEYGDATQCRKGTVETTNGICPDDYHWHNDGNWSQKCHRDHFWMHPEHKSPTSCPTGFSQVGDACSKTTYTYANKIIDVSGSCGEWEDGRGEEERWVDTTYRAGPDADADGVCDSSDNCPRVANPSQEDSDDNGIGNACEVAVDCQLSDWSDCSVSCGEGTQTRTITQAPANGGAACEDLSQSCNLGDCPPDIEDVCENLEGVQETVPEGYVQNGENCDPEARPTASPTPTPTPTPAPFVPPTCTGDQHLDASGRNCVSFGVPGVESPTGGTGGQVLGTSTTGGQVLGTSTMAATGVAQDTLFSLVFILGCLFTSAGVRKITASRV